MKHINLFTIKPILNTRITKIALLSIFALATLGVNEAWAKWPEYSGTCNQSGFVVYDASLELNTIDSEEINLAGPGAKVTFEAKHTLTGAGDMKVAQYVNGKWSSSLWNANPGEEVKVRPSCNEN